jgi:hypothetical protein
MSFLSFFTKPRIANPTQGNTQFVKGHIFDPGAEVWATESTVADPAYTLTVFPQWNFTPLQVYQGSPMVFQSLALPDYPMQGFPFGGMLSTGLMHPEDYPNIEGDYFS